MWDRKRLPTKSQSIEGGHGRIEARKCTLCSDVDWLRDQHQSPALKSVVMMEYTREIRGKTETARLFYIASFEDNSKSMAKYIRNHWQVEKSLRRVPDVTLRQDKCRIRTGNYAANFATIKHAAINLLRKVPGKMSLPQSAIYQLGMMTVWRKSSAIEIQPIPPYACLRST